MTNQASSIPSHCGSNVGRRLFNATSLKNETLYPPQAFGASDGRNQNTMFAWVPALGATVGVRITFIGSKSLHQYRKLVGIRIKLCQNASLRGHHPPRTRTNPARSKSGPNDCPNSKTASNADRCRPYSTVKTRPLDPILAAIDTQPQ